MKNLFLCFFLISLFLNPIGDIKSQNSSDITQKIDSDSSRLIEIFKDIHQNPELGFMEVRTSGIIEKELKANGFEVISGIAKTGLVGILKNGNGPIVMYRADMDCNSVKETTGLSYASTKTVTKEDGTETPVMHACGHDAHVTWLIGVAKFMSKNKNLWKGTLVLVGQPAEEPILGAIAMVEDGMYERGVPKPDILYALHTGPFPVGIILSPLGPQSAGCDQIDVVFNGIGGHGSSPQNTKDPVIMAADAVVMYQNIVSRVIDPRNSAVLTVGSIQAGSDNNVIPSSALLKLNLRWYEETDRRKMINGIRRINESIASAYDLPKEMYPTMTMKGWSLPLINDTAAAMIFNKGHEKIVPKENIILNGRPVMGSEDAHHLVIDNEKNKVYYAWVGVADAEIFAKAVAEGKETPYTNHNGDYKVELAAIPLGTKIAVSGLLEYFNHK